MVGMEGIGGNVAFGIVGNGMPGMLGSGGRVALGRVGIELLGIGGNVGRVGLGRLVGIGGNVGRVGFGRDGIGGRVGSWSRCRAPRPMSRLENANAMKRAPSTDPLKEAIVGC
ncbi:hypothetical protein LINPERHAP2_LOCUS11329 [Linum perenne]